MEPSPQNPTVEELVHSLPEDVRWLSGVAVRILRDTHLADDVCQEVWLGLREERPSRYELLGRLRRAVSRRWRGDRRRRLREERAARPEGVPSTEDLVLRREQLQRVWDAIGQLDEPFRSTLLLRFQEDMEPKAIAQALDVSHSTVTWRVRKGLERLRARLDADRERGGLSSLLLALPAGWRTAERVPATTPLAASAGQATFWSLSLLAMNKKLLSAVVVLALAGGWWAAQSAEPLESAHEGMQPAVMSSLTAARDSEPQPSKPKVQEASTARVAVAPKKTQVASLGDPIEAAKARVNLLFDGRKPAPKQLTVQHVHLLGGEFLPTPSTAHTIAYDGKPFDLPLADLAAFLYMEEAPTGYVEIEAPGFGKQRSVEQTFDGTPGAITEVTMRITSPQSVPVLLVEEAKDQPLQDGKVFLTGPSSKLGKLYRSAEEPIALQLVWPTSSEDHLFVHSEGFAIRAWSVEDILGLPVHADGVRRVPVASGFRLSGTIEMASGLPVPDDHELIYTVRAHESKAEPTWPAWITPRGSIAIDSQGRFQTEALPPGVVTMHLQRKRAPYDAAPASPAFHWELTQSQEDVRLIVPENSDVLTLNITWPSNEPVQEGGGRAALFIALYESAGPDDIAYGPQATDRTLLAEQDFVASGSDMPFRLPQGSLQPDRPLILCVGRSTEIRFERRLVASTSKARLVHAFSMEELIELPPLLSPDGEESNEAKASRRAARDLAAKATLRAK